MFNIVMIEELSYKTIDRRGIDIKNNNISKKGRLYTNTTTGQQGVNLRDVLDSGDKFVLTKVNGVSRVHLYLIERDIVSIYSYDLDLKASSGSSVKKHKLLDTSKISIESKDMEMTSYINKNSRSFYPILNFYKKYENNYDDYYFSGEKDKGKIFVAELAKLFPRPFFMHKNSIYSFYNIEDLFLYFNQKEPLMGNGPKAKELQRLLDKTDGLTLDAYRKGFKNGVVDKHSFDTIETFTISEKINIDNKDYTLIRVLYLDKELDDENKLNDFEFIRMYYSGIDGKVDINAAIKNHSGGWANKRFSKNWNFTVNLDEDKMVGDLRYLTKDYLNEEESLPTIVTTSKSIREVETLTKSSSVELNEISKQLLREKETPAQVKKLLTDIYFIPENVIGGYKNVWELIGFNSEQVNVLLKDIDVIKKFASVRDFDEYNSLDLIVRKLFADVLTLLNYIYVSDVYIVDNNFERRDFRDMDIESFRAVVETYIEVMRNINEFSKKYIKYKSILPHINFDSYIHGISSVKDLEYFRDNTENILRKMRENYEEEEIMDYYGRYYTIKIHPNQYFPGYCEVRRDLVTVRGRQYLPDITILNKPKNIEREEVKARRTLELIVHGEGESLYEKILEDSNDLTFEDDEYIIFRAPSLTSIVDEGKALNHCVAEYTDSAARGKTSIYFLRSKSNKDIPLYTIEIENSILQQAKGFNNIRLDKNATNFINKWKTKFNLK